MNLNDLILGKRLEDMTEEELIEATLNARKARRGIREYKRGGGAKKTSATKKAMSKMSANDLDALIAQLEQKKGDSQ